MAAENKLKIRTTDLAEAMKQLESGFIDPDDWAKQQLRFTATHALDHFCTHPCILFMSFSFTTGATAEWKRY